jgi:hypothetical protein
LALDEPVPRLAGLVNVEAPTEMGSRYIDLVPMFVAPRAKHITLEIGNLYQFGVDKVDRSDEGSPSKDPCRSIAYCADAGQHGRVWQFPGTIAHVARGVSAFTSIERDLEIPRLGRLGEHNLE